MGSSGRLRRNAASPGFWTRFRQGFGAGVLRALRALEEIGGSLGEGEKVYLRFREAELDERALVRTAFAYLKRIAQEYGLRAVFLLDEFQEMARFDPYVFPS